MHGATPEELRQYQDQGFFYRERVFPEAELEALRRAAENAHGQIIEAAASEEAPPVDRVDNQRYQMLRGSTIKWEWRDELPAGSVLWFHRDLVHGSQSNRSETNRRVFVTAYQPAGLKRWRLDKKRPIPGA